MPRFYETTLSITNLHNLSISTHVNRSRIYETSASDRRQTSGGNPVCVCATVRLGQIEPIRDEKEIQRHGVMRGHTKTTE